MSIRSRHMHRRTFDRTLHSNRLLAFLATQAARIGITSAALFGDMERGVNAAEATDGTKPSNTVAAVVAGTGTVGQTLTVTPGTWAGTPAPNVTRQWRRSGATLAGVTGLTYTLVSNDSGHNIDCQETAVNDFGTVTQNSNAIAVA